MLKTGHDLTDAEIRRAYDRLPHVGRIGGDFLTRVLDVAGDLGGLRVLDVGAGRGELLAAISTRAPTARRWGLELSPERAGRARAADASRIVVADIGPGLPFAASSFDRVFCLETLEHLKRPAECLREIVRVLAPGGRVILSLPNATGFTPFHRLGALLPGRWLKGKLLPYEHPLNTGQPIDTCLDFAEILALVLDAGLDIETVRGYRYFRYLEMLPGTRRLYPWLGRTFERLMPRVGGVRFAYNLIVRCRVARGAPA